MTSATAIHQLFDSVGNCLSLDAASKLQQMRVPDNVQTQLDEWATKNTEERLGAGEREDYEAILRTLNFISILQAKARRISADANGS